MLPPWTRRGHQVGVRCTPDKAPPFRAAGAHIVGHADADHPWLPPAHGEPHNSINHWSGNKAGHDPAQPPLPRIGTVAGLWDEYCNVSLSLDGQVRDEYAVVVLWRKNAFGCQSEAGCRFVERLLTVVQTRRLQGRSVLGYLYDALVAHRNRLPAPSLLAAE
jgi:hypothetical protein